jgi:hypothetical protein
VNGASHQPDRGTLAPISPQQRKAQKLTHSRSHTTLFIVIAAPIRSNFGGVRYLKSFQCKLKGTEPICDFVGKGAGKKDGSEEIGHYPSATRIIQCASVETHKETDKGKQIRNR